MASVMCMLLLLIPLPVSANDLGSILLKATVEDETTVYKLSNTEFTMYQVGTYKNNSWALVSEFAKSGVIFDFDDSSAQAEAAKKLEKYVQDNNIKGMSGKTNSDGEVMYRDLEKGVYLFVQTQKTQISNQVYQSEPFIITVPGNYGGKSIFLADAITDPADFMVAPLIGNILVMINKTCCIKDDVVMDMIFINMGAYHIFIFSFQYFVCKLLP